MQRCLSIFSTDGDDDYRDVSALMNDYWRQAVESRDRARRSKAHADSLTSLLKEETRKTAALVDLKSRSQLDLLQHVALVDDLQRKFHTLLTAFRGLAVAHYYHCPTDPGERQRQCLQYVVPVRGVDRSLNQLYTDLYYHQLGTNDRLPPPIPPPEPVIPVPRLQRATFMNSLTDCGFPRSPEGTRFVMEPNSGEHELAP